MQNIIEMYANMKEDDDDQELNGKFCTCGNQRDKFDTCGIRNVVNNTFSSR